MLESKANFWTITHDPVFLIFQTKKLCFQINWKPVCGIHGPNHILVDGWVGGRVSQKDKPNSISPLNVFLQSGY